MLRTIRARAAVLRTSFRILVFGFGLRGVSVPDDLALRQRPPQFRDAGGGDFGVLDLYQFKTFEASEFFKAGITDMRRAQMEHLQFTESKNVRDAEIGERSVMRFEFPKILKARNQRGWLATTKECPSTIVPYARKVRSSTSERL